MADEGWILSQHDRLPARPPKPPAMGRPRGSYGEVALAMRNAATQGPGTVREIAARASVGYRAAQYTATRLLAAGDLQQINQGRPALLAAPASVGGEGHRQAPGSLLNLKLHELQRMFWRG